MSLLSYLLNKDGTALESMLKDDRSHAELRVAHFADAQAALVVDGLDRHAAAVVEITANSADDLYEEVKAAQVSAGASKMGTGGGEVVCRLRMVRTSLGTITPPRPLTLLYVLLRLAQDWEVECVDAQLPRARVLVDERMCQGVTTLICMMRPAHANDTITLRAVQHLGTLLKAQLDDS